MGLVREPRDTRSGRRGTVGRNQAELFASVRQCERRVRVCVHVHTRLCVCVFQGAVLLHGSASLVIFFLP